MRCASIPRIRSRSRTWASSSRNGATHPAREEEELERDGYIAFHDGRDLVLNQEARDALLLELPMAPRCREDCAGLCPRCGADRNLGPCGCDAE